MLRLRVKEVAAERGYTMSGLSRASNVSIRTIVHLCKRPDSDATISTLEKIALVLGVQIGDLVERVPDTQN
jgi:DNA-binding Xre family transcriptional regulator